MKQGTLILPSRGYENVVSDPCKEFPLGEINSKYERKEGLDFSSPCELFQFFLDLDVINYILAGATYITSAAAKKYIDLLIEDLYKAGKSSKKKLSLSEVDIHNNIVDWLQGFIANALVAQSQHNQRILVGTCPKGVRVHFSLPESIGSNLIFWIIYMNKKNSEEKTFQNVLSEVTCYFQSFRHIVVPFFRLYGGDIRTTEILIQGYIGSGHSTEPRWNITIKNPQRVSVEIGCDGAFYGSEEHFEAIMVDNCPFLIEQSRYGDLVHWKNCKECQVKSTSNMEDPRLLHSFRRCSKCWGELTCSRGQPA